MDPGSPVFKLARARTRARLAALEMDVEAQLSDPTCSEKTPKSARGNRTGTICFALPQLVNGKCVWPEHWGISRRQIEQLLLQLRREPDWRPENSVYTLVSDFVIPWTQGKGVSYALLLNGDEPKEVNLMVSHAWGENAEEFLEALLRSTTDEDVLFVCALSLYQAEDGVGPSIAEQVGVKLSESPFRRVLKHIERRGKEAGWRWRWRNWLANVPMFCLLMSVVIIYLPTLMWGCVPVNSYCVELHRKRNIDIAGEHMSELLLWAWGLGSEALDGEGWVWWSQGPWFCIFTAAALLSLACTAASWLVLQRARPYAGRMVVVPNREVDIYSRLWCVYEIWVAESLGVGVEVARTLATAGKAHARMAQCGLEEDTERIMREIEAHGPNTCDHIDKAVFLTTRGSRWQAAKVSLFYGFLIAIFVVAFLRVRGSTKDVLAMVNGIMVACIMIVWAVYTIFRCAQGTPTFAAVLACCCLLAGLGAVLDLYLRALALGSGLYYFVEHLSRCLMAGGVYLLLFLLAACLCPPTRRLGPGGSLPLVAASSASVLAFLTVLEVSTTGADSLVPSLVSNAAFVCGYLFFPVFLGWSAAARWGVRVRLRATGGSCQGGI